MPMNIEVKHHDEMHDLDNFPLAYAYVPMQKLGKVYTEPEALSKGTLFPELYKPLGVYGNEFSGKIPTDVCPKENMKDTSPYEEKHDNKPFDNNPFGNLPFGNPFANKPYENDPNDNTWM